MALIKILGAVSHWTQYLEVVVALHVVVHVAADLDGVALPETVVGALDLFGDESVELEGGAESRANLVLVLKGKVLSKYFKGLSFMLRYFLDKKNDRLTSQVDY